MTKTKKGKKFLYEVKDKDGNVVSDRVSARDYVACSVSGEFYFGRIDLVGKGDYSKRFPTDPETIEKKVAEIVEYGKQMLAELEIAYLK